MSELQRRIGRVQRREGPRIGFGAVAREQPRAMLLGLVVNDGAGAKAALAANADAVIVTAASAADAASIIKGLNGEKVCAGALLDSLDDAGAAALIEAKCDFVISTLDGTAATAVDTEAMGQALIVPNDIDDTTLRALGPLGLDALYLDREGIPTSLEGQLELVRLASFAGTPLLVTVHPGASEAELRVLRDSGAVMVIPPARTTAEQAARIIEALKAVPAPRRGRRDGHDIALVPALSRSAHNDEEETEEPDEE